MVIIYMCDNKVIYNIMEFILNELLHLMIKTTTINHNMNFMFLIFQKEHDAITLAYIDCFE